MTRIARAYVAVMLSLVLVLGSDWMALADDPKEPFTNMIGVCEDEVYYYVDNSNTIADFTEGTDPYKVVEGEPTLTTDLEVTLVNNVEENAALYIYGGDIYNSVDEPAHFTVEGDATMTEQHENRNMATSKDIHAVELYSYKNTGEIGATVEGDTKVSVIATGNRVANNNLVIEEANVSALYIDSCMSKGVSFDGSDVIAEAIATATGASAEADASGIETWRLYDVDNVEISVNDISATATAKTETGFRAEANAAGIILGNSHFDENVHIIANNVTAEASAEHKTSQMAGASATAVETDQKGTSGDIVIELKGDAVADAESLSSTSAIATAIKASGIYTGTGENEENVTTQIVVDGKASARTTLLDSGDTITSGYNSWAVNASSSGEKADTFVKVKKGAYGTVSATANNGGTTKVIIDENGITQDSWSSALNTKSENGGEVIVDVTGDMTTKGTLLYSENESGTTEISVNADQLVSQDGGVIVKASGNNANTILSLKGDMLVCDGYNFDYGAVRLETTKEEPASTVTISATIEGNITAADSVDPIAMKIVNNGGTISADIAGNVSSEHTGVVIGDPLTAGTTQSADTMLYVTGDVEGGKYGLKTNLLENQTANVVVNGTIEGSEASILLVSEETILTDKNGENGNMTMTVWKVEPNDDGAVVMRQKEDAETGSTICEEDVKAEEAIQYIIRIRDTQNKYIETNGTRTYEANGKSYQVANEGDRVLVKLNIPDDQELVGAYWDEDQELTLLTDNEGNYYLDVKRGGGVELSVKMKPKQKEEEQSGNEDRNPSQDEEKNQKEPASESNSGTNEESNTNGTSDSDATPNSNSASSSDAAPNSNDTSSSDAVPNSNGTSESDTIPNSNDGSGYNEDPNSNSASDFAPASGSSVISSKEPETVLNTEANTVTEDVKSNGSTNPAATSNLSVVENGESKIILTIVDTTDTVTIVFYSNSRYITKGPDNQRETGWYKLVDDQIVLINGAGNEMPITRSTDGWKLIFISGKDATAFEFLISDNDVLILMGR